MAEFSKHLSKNLRENLGEFLGQPQGYLTDKMMAISMHKTSQSVHQLIKCEHHNN